ncbi:MAG: PspC domain-containing protein [Lachnospiraceae bacterium]|nr:PspC domain-containing protein [Lachnospiraceae bacterium]MDD3796482.1 PspC domain-containing protein [Lachnospiraceae bacterium]
MSKKMYKSKNDKMICGVCGGIAEYFGIDATIVRLIFAFLGLVSVGVIFYIIAAIVMPNPEY